LKLHVIPGTRRTRPALPDSNSAGFLTGIPFVSDAELVTAENFINSREIVLFAFGIPPSADRRSDQRSARLKKISVCGRELELAQVVLVLIFSGPERQSQVIERLGGNVFAGLF